MDSVAAEIVNNPEFEEIVAIDGYLVYLKGHPHPFKGVPSIEALDFVNRIKRRPWTVFSEKPLPNFTPFGKELEKIHPLFANIFEYDYAYRFRLQHLISLTTKENLLQHPRQTVLKLLEENRKRDLPEVHQKFKLAAYLLVLTVPLWRHFVYQLNWNHLLPDEGDVYWAKRRTDYKYER